jgi:hypothetical protein
MSCMFVTWCQGDQRTRSSLPCGGGVAEASERSPGGFCAGDAQMIQGTGMIFNLLS